MSEKTEQFLKEWNNFDRDTQDDLFDHFSEFGRWDWTEISEEARRVYNLMFDSDVEDESPLDGIWTAAAAQAADGAFAAVAACLGVNARALYGVIEDWYENQDEPPESISPDELIVKINEYEKWLRDLKETPNAGIHRAAEGRPVE